MSYMKNTKSFRAAPQGIILPQDLDFGVPPSKNKIKRKSEKKKRNVVEKQRNETQKLEKIQLQLDIPVIALKELRFMVIEKYNALKKLSEVFEDDMDTMKALLMLETRLRLLCNAFHEEEEKADPSNYVLDSLTEKILEIEFPNEFEKEREKCLNELFDCSISAAFKEHYQKLQDSKAQTRLCMPTLLSTTICSPPAPCGLAKQLDDYA